MSILYHERPFNTRYVVWQAGGRQAPELLRTHRTARASRLYITRQHGLDAVGPLPDWSRRDDLIATGRCGPQRAADPGLDGIALWTLADAQARDMRPDEPVCAHSVGSLPLGEDVAGWRNLVEGFCEDHFAAQGMIVDWAIHHRPATGDTPEIMPHVHLLTTMRVYDRDHADVGRLRQTWLRTEKARKRMAERWWAHTGLYPRAYALAA